MSVPPRSASVLLVALALVLAGCSQGDPAPTAADGTTVADATGTEIIVPPEVGPGYEWRPDFAENPAPRAEIVTANLGSMFYVIGGLSGDATGFGSASAQVDRYDAAKDSWGSGAAYPYTVHHAAAAHDGSKLYVFGGFFGAAFTPVPTSFVYDPAANSWAQIAPMPTPRAEHTAAFWDGKFYIWGGIEGAVGFLGATHTLTGLVYDPAANTWAELSAQLPTARDHLTSVAMDGQVYVIGGYGPFEDGATQGERGSDAFEVYDVAAGTFAATQKLPTARGALASTVWQEQVVVVGGQNATGILGVAEAFDAQTGAWRTLPEMTVGRYGLGAATFGAHAYVFGGNQVGGGVSGVVEALMPRMDHMGDIMSGQTMG